MGNNIVHVIGTGTIGEPLIGLLARHKDEFNSRFEPNTRSTLTKHSPGFGRTSAWR